jgi:hypothetical protein
MEESKEILLDNCTHLRYHLETASYKMKYPASSKIPRKMPRAAGPMLLDVPGWPAPFEGLAASDAVLPAVPYTILVLVRVGVEVGVAAGVGIVCGVDIALAPPETTDVNN